MKRILLCAIALSVAALPLWPDKVSLALVRVEPIGVPEQTAKIVEEVLQGEFANLPLFRLVERDKLGVLLEEQQLQVSGVTNAETAVKAGSVLNVQKVVFGTIGRYQSDYVAYILSLRLVDVERGVIEASENTDIGSDRDIRDAAARLVQRLASRIAITGKVSAVQDGAVYTSLGMDLGVKKGDSLAAYRISLVKDNVGKILLREEVPVANMEVDQVSEEGSRCLVLEKATVIEPGLSVRPGKVALANVAKGAGLIVTSIPDNSRVFINSEFVGVTPVSKLGLKPGVYTVEIRGSGYKPYAAKVNLGEGRTVTIERELEQVVEVEDLILMGEVPRRQTDPKTALLKSLIPGAGLAYNGYPSAAPAVDFAVVWGLGGAGLMLASGFGTWTGYYDTALSQYQAGDTSYGTMRNAAMGGAGQMDIEKFILGGHFVFGLLPYLASVIDGPFSAREEFLYPTFLEVSMGGAAGQVYRSQTADTKTPTGASEATSAVNAGIDANLLLEGRKLMFDFDLAVGGTGIGIDFGIGYRLYSRGSLLPGLGLTYAFTQSLAGGYGPTAPLIDIAAAATLSFRGRSLEADLWLAPVEYYYSIALAAPALGGTSCFCAGIRADLDLRWFFSRTVGLRLAASGRQMWNLMAPPSLGGYSFTVLDQFRQFEGSGAVVFRF
jgi:hypothetical protein